MANNDALIEAIYQIQTGGHVPAAAARGAGGLGWRLPRAAAADPQNVWQPLFTIAGGLIAVTGLYGLRTVIQAGGASNIQFRHSVGPTVITGGACSVAADTVGTIYLVTGDITDDVQKIVGGGPLMAGKTVAAAVTYGSIPLFIMGVGTIDVIMTAAAGTGSTQYILTYIPLDDAVTVV